MPLKPTLQHCYSLMVGILFGQVATSLVVDHWGLLGSNKRAVDKYRIGALIAILAALWLIQ